MQVIRIKLRDEITETPITVVYPDEVSFYLTEEDREMDRMACLAVSQAIAKAELLGKILDL